MTIHNPTANTVSITISGRMLSVEPYGTVNDISKEMAEKWRAVHAFLVIGDDAPELVVVAKPLLVEEVPAEEIKEMVEEKPKKKLFKKK